MEPRYPNSDNSNKHLKKRSWLLLRNQQEASGLSSVLLFLNCNILCNSLPHFNFWKWSKSPLIFTCKFQPWGMVIIVMAWTIFFYKHLWALLGGGGGQIKRWLCKLNKKRDLKWYNRYVDLYTPKLISSEKVGWGLRGKNICYFSAPSSNFIRHPEVLHLG